MNRNIHKKTKKHEILKGYSIFIAVNCLETTVSNLLRRFLEIADFFLHSRLIKIIRRRALDENSLTFIRNILHFYQF